MDLLKTWSTRSKILDRKYWRSAGRRCGRVPRIPLMRHSQAEDLKLWKLLFRSPLDTWFRGKAVLIGDAAHPMLPRECSSLFHCSFS